jgi:hypothetical protein
MNVILLAALSFHVSAGDGNHQIRALMEQSDFRIFSYHLANGTWAWPKTNAVDCDPCSLQHALRLMFKGTGFHALVYPGPLAIVVMEDQPRRPPPYNLPVDSWRPCQCAKSEDSLPLGPWCRDGEGLHYMPEVCSRFD